MICRPHCSQPNFVDSYKYTISLLIRWLSCLAGTTCCRDLKDPKDLVRCDRQLMEKLKALDANALTEKTNRYLTKDEVKAVMARRDKIVAQFQKLIAEKGESEVLY